MGLRRCRPNSVLGAGAGSGRGSLPELLRWVQALWTPCEGETDTEPPLVLALDATQHRDEWVALVVGVAYRQHAIPVAWHVVAAQDRESWAVHYGRLLRLLAPASPPIPPGHVLCDQGLDSPDLWRQITALAGNPVLRYPPPSTFRPTDGDRVPPRTLPIPRTSLPDRNLQLNSPRKYPYQGSRRGPVSWRPRAAWRTNCGFPGLTSRSAAGDPRR